MIKIIQLGIFLGFVVAQILQAQETKKEDVKVEYKQQTSDEMKVQIEQLTDMLNAYVRKAQTCDIQLTDAQIKLEKALAAKKGK